MNIISLLIFIAIGALAGWLAGKFMRGGGFGLFGNILVGIVGAFIGSWVFGLVGMIISGIIGTIIAAVVGAIILLFIVKLTKSL